LFLFFFLRDNWALLWVLPCPPSKRAAVLSFQSSPERGFSGGNLSHGPDVHHTRETAGRKAILCLSHENYLEKALGLQQQEFIRTGPLENQRLGGALMNEQHFESKALPDS